MSKPSFFSFKQYRLSIIKETTSSYSKRFKQIQEWDKVHGPINKSYILKSKKFDSISRPYHSFD